MTERSCKECTLPIRQKENGEWYHVWYPIYHIMPCEKVVL